MNSSAVALAADSAVTIGRGRKIYNTINKLFTLSKYQPIGVMVYGNAEFMRVPWEVLIKIYRQRLGPQGFTTVKEYAADFIRFLEGSETPLFPASVQSSYLKGWVAWVLEQIKKAVDAKVESKIKQDGRVMERL